MVRVICAGLLIFSFMTVLPCHAGSDTIALPPVEKQGGMSLMQALEKRKTTRTFSSETISEQLLSNLLWATYGVSRDDGRRTIPTARNQQRIQLYVALSSGIWLYDSAKNNLTRVLAKDVRPQLGAGQIMLIYAAPEEQWADMHVGSMYQNAGLYCASVGLGNVVRAQAVPAVKKLLLLPTDYTVRMVQAIGWPK